MGDKTINSSDHYENQGSDYFWRKGRITWGQGIRKCCWEKTAKVPNLDLDGSYKEVILLRIPYAIHYFLCECMCFTFQEKDLK